MFGQMKAGNARRDAAERKWRGLQKRRALEKHARGEKLTPDDLAGLEDEFLRQLWGPAKFRQWKHKQEQPPSFKRKRWWCRLFGCKRIDACRLPECVLCPGRCQHCGSPPPLPPARML